MDFSWNMFGFKGKHFIVLCFMLNPDRKLEVFQSQEITSENWAEEQKRQQLTDGAFGTNLQPKLERIEFKMQTRLQSRQQFPQLISPISCNVRFEGSSVIEGIKNLGSQSFVDIPLPSYMTNLHSLSRSSLLLIIYIKVNCPSTGMEHNLLD